MTSIRRATLILPFSLAVALATVGCIRTSGSSGVKGKIPADSNAYLETAMPSDFFSSATPLAFSFEGDVGAMLASKAYAPGTLSFTGGKSFAVEAKVRGNNSLVDCDFPKLSVRIPKAATAEGPFAANRKIKLHTHCGEGGMGTFRLKDQIAAWRQAAIYDVLAAADLTVPRVRRAVISYTLPKEEPLTRKAFVMEDSEDTGKRVGFKSLSDEEVAALGNDWKSFDEVALMEQLLVQALVANGDWSFPALSDEDSGEGIRNFEVLDRGVDAKPRYVPYSHDFDLGSWVTGKVLEKSQASDEGIEGETNIHALQANTLLMDARDMVVGEERFEELFPKAAKRFLDKEKALRAALNSSRFAENDPEGKKIAKAHLNGFFKALKRRVGTK